MRSYKSVCLLFFMILVFTSAESYGQKGKKGKKGNKEHTEKPEGKKKTPPKKGVPKPYKDVITEKAVTQKRVDDYTQGR